MFRKFTLVAAFGAGYVLGAKAGTQRYNQILAKARDLAGKPAVQDLRDKASHQVSEAAAHVTEAAKDAAGEAIAGVRAKVSSDDSSDAKTSPSLQPRV